MPNDRLSLEVTLSAFAWDAHKRRLAFLEAALVQTMTESQQLRQWFSAAALASMRLPGMPASRNGVIQKAEREGWVRRIVTGRGGERYEYHYAGLPRPAFDEIIRRVLSLPVDPAEGAAGAEVLPPAARSAPGGGGVSPQWLLPLMRIVKAGAIDAETAMRELPDRLPAGVPVPTLSEIAAAMLAYRSR